MTGGSVCGWRRKEAVRTARGAVPTSIQLCRDAVPTLHSAAEPRGDSGWRLGTQRGRGGNASAIM